MQRRTFITASAGWMGLSSSEGRGEEAGKEADYRGRTRAEILTPALLVDLAVLDANLAAMADHCKKAGCGFRPHAKTHKCPEIARRQLASGALGVCVATVPEAEVMVRAGLRGVLLTSPVLEIHKIAQLADLARKTDLMVSLGHVRQAEMMSQVAQKAGLTFNILIDLDIGDRRTGALPGPPALELGQWIGRTKNLRLRGLQAFAGHASHVVGFAQREKVSRDALGKALETRDLFRKSGLDTAILSVGSTGTYNIDSSVPGVTELQVGSYVFMDVDYRRIGGRNDPTVFADFRPSLTVLATVVNANHPDRVTIDAGTKALDTTVAWRAEPRQLPEVQYRPAGDKFGTLTAAPGGRLPRLGDRVELLVPHCDPTTNLFDRMYAMRGERVEAVWPILARRSS